MRVLVFDIESTGLDTAHDRIVEFGCVVYEDDEKPIYETGSVINPEMTMDRQVIQIHGITNEQAKAGADWKKYVESKIIPLFEKCDIAAGHNIAGFDLPILRSNVARVGFELPAIACLDTLQVARRFYVKDKYSLGYLCELYGIDLVNAHRALDDAKANGELLIRMAKELKIRLADLADHRPVKLGYIGHDPFEAVFYGQRGAKIQVQGQKI